MTFGPFMDELGKSEAQVKAREKAIHLLLINPGFAVTQCGIEIYCYYPRNRTALADADIIGVSTVRDEVRGCPECQRIVDG